MTDKTPSRDTPAATTASHAAVEASASTLIGRLAGATVALPAAAGVFVIGALAGVPGEAALLRAVIWGVGLGLGTSLAVRVLFAYLVRDWRRARTASKGGRAS